MKNKGLKRILSLLVGSAVLATWMPNQGIDAIASDSKKQTTEVAKVREYTTPTGGVQEKVVAYSKKELEQMPDFTPAKDPVTFFSAGTTEWNDSSTKWNTADKVTYGGSDYGYQKLTDAQKSIYTTILYSTAGSNLDGTGDCFWNSVTLNGATGYTVAYTGTSDDAAIAYCAFYEDHPEFYWLQSACSIVGTDLIVLVDPLYDTKAERDAIQTAMNDTGGERQKLINAYNAAGNDDYKKMLLLHNKIIEDVTYAYKGNTKTPETASWAHSIVGALTESYVDSNGNHQVVCEGYAKTFQYILNIVGHSNVYVIGTSKGEGHAWNIVKVGSDWYNMDLTWDDSVAAGKYMYVAMPNTYFSRTHTPNTAKSTIWLYDLPTADDTKDLSKTYYGKYQAYATTSNCSDASAFVRTAGASSIDDNLYILCDTMGLVGNLTSALNIGSYYHATEYGKYFIYKENEAVKYKVTTPADNLSVDKAKVTIDVKNNKNVQLTYTSSTSGTNDYVQLSLTDASKVFVKQVCTPLVNGKATVTVTGVRNGTTSVIAKPLVGNAAAVTTAITVTGASMCQTLYKDETGTAVVTESDMVGYANGGKVKENGITKNYKTIESYTDMAVPEYTTSKGKKAKGKVIVGITSSEDIPEVKNNKIVSDARAKQMASASIKSIRNSSYKKVTVTAKKDPGEVYLWVISLTTKDTICKVDYCPITILAAPTSIKVKDSIGQIQKSGTTYLGGSVSVNLDTTYKNSQRQTVVTNDATYTVSFGKDSDYATVSCLGTKSYLIMPTKLKNNKVTTIKVTFQCRENGKKAVYTLKVGNSVTAVRAVSGSKSKLTAKSDSTNISYIASSEKYSDITSTTTDSVKVMVEMGIPTQTTRLTNKSKVYKAVVTKNKGETASYQNKRYK